MTPKQKLFVHHYLIEHNATKAAESAGYSAKTAHVQGCRLLRNAQIKALIEQKDEKRAEKLEITADYVLGSVKEVIEESRQLGKTYNQFASLKGLELLGKHRKLWTDKIEHSGSIDIGFAEQLEKARRRVQK